MVWMILQQLSLALAMKDNMEQQRKRDGVATMVLTRNHPQLSDQAASNLPSRWKLGSKALAIIPNTVLSVANSWATIKDSRVRKRETSWKLSQNKQAEAKNSCILVANNYSSIPIKTTWTRYKPVHKKSCSIIQVQLEGYQWVVKYKRGSHSLLPEIATEMAMF